MNFMQRIAERLRPTEQRMLSSDPNLASWFGLGTDSGQTVTSARAEGMAAIYSAIQLLSETIASLPLHVYRRGDDGDKIDRNHPLHSVLNYRANQTETAFEARERMVASVLLTGNCVTEKTLDGRGAVTELTPIPPGRVGVIKLPTGRLRYDIQTDRGSKSLTQDEVLHLKHRSVDGIMGRSPIAVARESIGVGLAQQAAQAALLRGGIRPAGILKLPGTVRDRSKLKMLSEQFSDSYGGANNTGRLVVLEGGLEWQQVSLSPADAQFVEAMRMSIEDVARIFRIPPPFLAALENATYSNITEQSRWLVMHTLRPWLVRIEQAMNASLLTTDGRRTHYIKHNADALLRGSTKERYEAHSKGIEWGFLSPNEVREMENLNAIEGGDQYRAPMNMERLDDANDDS